MKNVVYFKGQKKRWYTYELEIGISGSGNTELNFYNLKKSRIK